MILLLVRDYFYLYYLHLLLVRKQIHLQHINQFPDKINGGYNFVIEWARNRNVEQNKTVPIAYRKKIEIIPCDRNSIEFT